MYHKLKNKYQPKIKGKYGAPLLKDNERRLRAHMCKQAAQIRLLLNLNSGAIT